MQYFNLHTHSSSNQSNVFELVNQYPQEFSPAFPFYSIGIHPWFGIENQLESDLAIIESKMNDPKCLAIGECGLDKRIASPFGLQKNIFERQLILAQRYQKPVVVHCVAAFQELIEIKIALKISVPLLIHGFSKSEALAHKLVANGCYLSFGKSLLHLPQLASVFKTIPNDRFFLETDTSTETIQDIYALASKYKEIDLAAIQKQLKSNWQHVFKTQL